jgi:glycosyl transferase family 2
MKISIALATYNGERWLREQLDSLARQTLLPCELVVSDDQSTDGTLDVVQQFAGTSPFPVRVLREDVRRGFADNFMNALRGCTGDAVAYCDQDDVWRPTKLERCAAAMDSDSGITLVHHDSEEVDGDLRSLGIVLRPTGNASRDCPEHLVLLTMPGFGCCMLVRRSVVDAVLKYWPEAHLKYVNSSGSRGAFGHDLATLHVASALGKVEYLSEALICHRRHQQNTWSPDITPGRMSKSQEFTSRAIGLHEIGHGQAVRASMYAEMAERANVAGDRAVANYLARLASRTSSLARFHAGRADLYDATSRISACRRFTEMLAGGAYAGIGGALISTRGAFKDLGFVLIGPRAAQLMETVRDKLRLSFQPQEVLK